MFEVRCFKKGLYVSATKIFFDQIITYRLILQFFHHILSDIHENLINQTRIYKVNAVALDHC